MREYKLSPSTLNLFAECPRCFWLLMNKELGRPRGPMPSIAIGLDSAITRYFHYYRQNNELPPVVRKDVEGNVIEGRLVNEELFDLSRGVKAKWLVYEPSDLPVVVLGKLDDCLVMADGYSPLDYKTRSSVPEDVHPAYKRQMDIYTFLLRENKARKFPVNNRAYLLYFCPRYLKEGEMADTVNMEALPFNIALKPVPTNPDKVRSLVEQAFQTIIGDIPDAGSECEYCSYAGNRLADLGSQPAAKVQTVAEKPVYSRPARPAFVSVEKTAPPAPADNFSSRHHPVNEKPEVKHPIAEPPPEEPENPAFDKGRLF